MTCQEAHPFQPQILHLYTINCQNHHRGYPYVHPICRGHSEPKTQDTYVTCPPVTFNLYQVGSLQSLANFRTDEGQPPPALSPASNGQSRANQQAKTLNSPLIRQSQLAILCLQPALVMINFLSFPNSLISTSQQQAPLRLTPVNRLVGFRGPQNASRRCDCSPLASRKVHSLQLSVTSLRPDTEAMTTATLHFSAWASFLGKILTSTLLSPSP
ncbi:hypothetical protein CKAH01_07396 [Colletotrichum kahawae]|uniref:Uncharacterized protein n=1 Tax=Colletotrichum kahawae TaxID=34407 RepID=A0AAD9Y6Q2_COLKA|nr:hypothetical protein CKAH01_07396 [Colletotrichum kahawae]